MGCAFGKTCETYGKLLPVPTDCPFPLTPLCRSPSPPGNRSPHIRQWPFVLQELRKLKPQDNRACSWFCKANKVPFCLTEILCLSFSCPKSETRSYHQHAGVSYFFCSSIYIQFRICLLLSHFLFLWCTFIFISQFFPLVIHCYKMPPGFDTEKQGGNTIAHFAGLTWTEIYVRWPIPVDGERNATIGHGWWCVPVVYRVICDLKSFQWSFYSAVIHC